MKDVLFVAVVGEQNAGKSETWNTLFDGIVRSSAKPHSLEVATGEFAEVLLISGSHKERDLFAKKTLKNLPCRIVLCSVQYEEDEFRRTWNYVFDQGFRIYAQWLNPGHTGREYFDRLGLMSRLVAHNAVVSKRDGTDSKYRLLQRVEEIRQFIHGWAAARSLLSPARE